MARFMVKGKNVRGYMQESAICNLGTALHEANSMRVSGQYSVITILKDDEGEDHKDNAGKFFLYRIIK